jgi:hypothetical protein
MRMLVLLAQGQQIADATAELLKTGILGTLLVITLCAIAYLWVEGKALQKRKDSELAALNAEFVARLTALQDLRIQDQKQVTEQLLKLIEQCTTALNNVSNTLVATREAMTELKDSFKDLGEEFRRYVGPRRS